MKRLFPVICLFSWLVAVHSFAGSATWNLNPTSGDWNTAANWIPATVPNGPADVATFDVSNTTRVSLSDNIDINGIHFNPNATSYTITAGAGINLTIKGAGITNSSTKTQNFVADAGSIEFFGSSTAHDAIFTIKPGGGLGFSGSSTADHAFIVNEGGTTSNAFGGSTSFTDDSGAAEATIIARGASGVGPIRGFVGFESRARAENATLIATGGKNGGAGGEIFFAKFPSPSTARVELFGNGSLNFLASTLTIGSLEGDGLVDGDSGMARLVVGTNNLDTFFEGTISGVVYLDKVGVGTLTLGNATNYTQVTTILDGALLVTHHHGSATGYGPVYVNGGMLGGSGKIGGVVTVGTGQGLGATLSVGLTRSKPGVLTIQSQLTLQSDATCAIVVGNSKMTADRIIAKGVTIASGAVLSLVDLDAIVLDPGTSLKVISNTATTPIAGTFSNLPDGATITAGNNTFQASYSGGDGNDLTLTVL